MPVSEQSRTIREVRREAAGRLSDVGETPGLDAELLLRHVLGFDRMEFVLRQDEPLTPAQIHTFEQFVERRLHGEPVAYILGRRAFRTIELEVDRRVMVPRPETELMVENGLSWIAGHPGPISVVDVGTGSGAVAFSLAIELAPNRSNVAIVATDISLDALDVARGNRDRLGLAERVELRHADLLDGLIGPFDLILANLPYLRVDQRHPSTAWEPDRALYAGVDGLDLYRRLFDQLPQKLAAGGTAVVEIDPSQVDAGRRIAERQTGLTVEVRDDWAGRARFMVLVG